MPVDSKVTGFRFKIENKKCIIERNHSFNFSPLQICMLNLPFKVTLFKYSLALKF